MCLHACSMVVDPGCKVLYSVEQSDKSLAQAALCGIAQVLNIASVIIVKDAVNNARGVRDKVNDVVTAMRGLTDCGDVEYLSGSARDWAHMYMYGCKKLVAAGEVTLVVPATTEALKQLCSYLMEVSRTNAF